MNHGELVAKLIRDLGNRTDITSDVSAAISSAVQYYQRERFHFLETATAMTMTSSVAYYAAPSNLSSQIDTMLLTVSGSRLPLARTHFSDIDEKDDGKTFGQPSEWCLHGNQLRFWPVPNATYTYRLAYHMQLDPPSDTASNAWTNIASELIRFRSAWDVQKHILKNAEQAASSKESEIEAYMQIMGESTKKLSTGTIKKAGW